MSDIHILNDRELTFLEQSSGDDCDMASIKCVVRELRQLRADRDRLAGEVEILLDVFMSAKSVVNERRATIKHARESTAMCRLAKKIDAYMSEPSKESP